MKNVKNGKQVSRLTGALLAKKGSATPSQASLSMNQTVINRFETEYEPAVQVDDNCPLENAIETVRELTTRQNKPIYTEKTSIKEKSIKKGRLSSRKSKLSKSSKQLAANKRIAMTLRMEEESHLKLRIFSAHTRKSCQVILTEALELYLAENSDRISGQKLASRQ